MAITGEFLWSLRSAFCTWEGQLCIVHNFYFLPFCSPSFDRSWKWWALWLSGGNVTARREHHESGRRAANSLLHWWTSFKFNCENHVLCSKCEQRFCEFARTGLEETKKAVLTSIQNRPPHEQSTRFIQHLPKMKVKWLSWFNSLFPCLNQSKEKRKMRDKMTGN